MRYFFFSFLLHSLGLAAILVWQGFPLESSKVSEAPMMISLTTMENQRLGAPDPLPPKAKKALSKKLPLTQKTQPSTTTEESKLQEVSIDSSTHQTLGTGRLPLSYVEELKSFIEQNKYYPQRAFHLRQSGTVVVKVEIAPDGHFRHVEVSEPCNHAVLNQAALDLVKDLKKFKPVPPELQTDNQFIVPVAYRLRGGSY